jgi:hypothetical protein
MNLFKSFTLTWWQAAIYKIGMLALGLAVGAHFHGLLGPYVRPMLAIALVALGYVTLVWWKQ